MSTGTREVRRLSQDSVAAHSPGVTLIYTRTPYGGSGVTNQRGSKRVVDSCVSPDSYLRHTQARFLGNLVSEGPTTLWRGFKKRLSRLWSWQVTKATATLRRPGQTPPVGSWRGPCIDNINPWQMAHRIKFGQHAFLRTSKNDIRGLPWAL